MSVSTLEGKLSRKLRYAARTRPVTIDDAAEFLAELGAKPSRYTIRKVLSRPKWRPVGWITTEKASRHGRPVRGWKPVRTVGR